jgi:hypothetical protein
MSKPKNAAEIFLLLDKSNCKKCGELTCLAFAGSVFLGQKKLQECPKLAREDIERYAGKPSHPTANEKTRDDSLKELASKIVHLDLPTAAERFGGVCSGDKLTLKVLGKDFSVDTQGNLFSEIHVNPWVAAPFLTHLLEGQGLPVSGQWVSFRELKGGRDRYPLFQKRCEESIKRVADSYPDLFDAVVHLFSGQQVEKQFKSDISVVLHPLPRVPVMICYWLPEEPLGSSLYVFFDETADRNLDIDSVFMLGTGLAQMFTKIALTHGFAGVVPDG